MTTELKPATRELAYDIEQFLYMEARLLDERKYHEWLDLFSEDAKYWMPVMGRRYQAASKAVAIVNGRDHDEDEFSKSGELAIFDETKASLASRISRLDTGMAWAEDPPSSTCRVVSNVEVCVRDVHELVVYSNLILYRTRAETERDFYVGRRKDVLRQSDGQWKISRRRIHIPQNVLSAKNVSNFF